MSFSISNIAIADSFYFKGCKFSEKAYGSYFIDFEKNEIGVVLKTTDGKKQTYTDKILLETSEMY